MPGSAKYSYNYYNYYKLSILPYNELSFMVLETGLWGSFASAKKRFFQCIEFLQLIFRPKFVDTISRLSMKIILHLVKILHRFRRKCTESFNSLNVYVLFFSCVFVLSFTELSNFFIYYCFNWNRFTVCKLCCIKVLGPNMC